MMNYKQSPSQPYVSDRVEIRNQTDDVLPASPVSIDRSCSSRHGSPVSPSFQAPIVYNTPNYSYPYASVYTATPPPTTVKKDPKKGIKKEDFLYSNGTYFGPYFIEKTLGQGSYGKVKLARHRTSQFQVALKIIHKSSIKKSTHLSRIRREIRLLNLCQHQNIIQLLSVHETELDIVLVLEYAPNGELLDYIQKSGKLDEDNARNIFKQILAAVEYCHAHCIVHRDLKPQNLLLKDSIIKLVDFGFCNLFDPVADVQHVDMMYHQDKLLSTYCGSPYYAAPEMISGTPYIGPEIDIWSLGVILYSMVVGQVPFNDDNIKGLYIKIQACQYDFPHGLSFSIKDLIKKMLTVDREKRISLAEIKAHHWVANYSLLPNDTSFSYERRPIYKSLGELNFELIKKLHLYDIDINIAHATIINEPYGRTASIYHLLLEKYGNDDGIVKPYKRNQYLNVYDYHHHHHIEKVNEYEGGGVKKKPNVGFVCPNRILTEDETSSLYEFHHYSLHCNQCVSRSNVHPSNNLYPDSPPFSPEKKTETPSKSHVKSKTSFNWLFKFSQKSGNYNKNKISPL